MKSKNSVEIKIHHKLKIERNYHHDIIQGRKTFEIRKNDRGFGIGDVVLLRRYENNQYTGDNTLVEITYITDYEQKEGYVVFGFNVLIGIFGGFTDE